MPRPRRRQQLPNVPVAAARQLQLKHLEPADPCRDPYILVVLLGLAQAQAETVAVSSSSSKTDRTRHEYRVSFLFPKKLFDANPNCP